MIESWETRILERLVGHANADGGWGYHEDLPSSAESTALICLALGSADLAGDVQVRGLKWLASVQRDDGAVPVTLGMSEPCWPTPLAMLAWSSDASPGGPDFVEAISRANTWLLSTRGKPLPRRPQILGHDTTIIGWPWVDGTHSWVEPTSYTILALRKNGLADHPRVREGVQLLWNRAVTDGGWNYGNTQVLGNSLRAFPAPTGIVLTALAAESYDLRADQAIAYLIDALHRIRSPISLAWGICGLTAWEKRPADANTWLRQCAQRSLNRPIDTVACALLLLASLTQSPFLERVSMSSHE